jgi:hypothetical protein
VSLEEDLVQRRPHRTRQAILLFQLYELRSCRGEVATYVEHAGRDTEQDARERDNWRRALDLERQATQLARRERDLQVERAAFYEQAFKTKRPGVGCRILAAITLGMHRCN